jgi:adenylate kinase
MKLVFLGPPGAGKGTVAGKLQEEFGLPQISTGDLFRNAIRDQTSLGKRVKSILDAGELVPDEVTVKLVKERLSRSDTDGGFILDGFPRTIPQAEALLSMTDVSAVVNFRVSEEEVVERLSGRRMCRSCGRSYHVVFMPPKKDGICDACGGELYIRDDDREEAVRNRMEVYRKQTAPLIDFFKDRKLLREIDASQNPAKVYEDAEKLVASLG